MLNGQNLLSVTKVICRQFLNAENKVLHKPKPVSSNDPTNTNHRQISLAGTDHSDSKLFSLRKKQSLRFLIFQKICRRPIEKNHISDISIVMTQIQGAGEEKQLLLKSRAHSFYTTNVSHYEPY